MMTSMDFVLRRHDGAPLVVAHGGTEAKHYRDVLEVLDAAIATGADMFEFDVRRTADDRLVVHHDEHVGAHLLRALTLAEARHAAAAAGYEIPTLDDLLQRAGRAVRLDVELKEPGYEADVLRLLHDRGFDSGDFVVTSFETGAVKAVCGHDPRVPTGLLVYDVSGPEALDMFSASGAAFLAPDHTIVDAGMLHAAATRSVPLVPWTVNDLTVMERLLRAPAVRALITDRPASALEARARIGAPPTR